IARWGRSNARYTTCGRKTSACRIPRPPVVAIKFPPEIPSRGPQNPTRSGEGAVRILHAVVGDGRRPRSPWRSAPGHPDPDAQPQMNPWRVDRRDLFTHLTHSRPVVTLDAALDRSRTLVL